MNHSLLLEVIRTTFFLLSVSARLKKKESSEQTFKVLSCTTNTCLCPCGVVQALKLFFGTVMAAPATINFRVARMAVQRLRGLFRIPVRVSYPRMCTFIHGNNNRLEITGALPRSIILKGGYSRIPRERVKEI